MVLGADLLLLRLRAAALGGRGREAAAQQLDFTPYAATSLPPGFDEQLVRADDFFGGPVVVSRYGVGSGPSAFAYQQRPGELSLENGRCSLRGLAGTGTRFYDGQAFSLLDGTLVRLEHTQVANRDVLTSFDALRRVAPEEIDFKQG